MKHFLLLITVIAAMHAALGQTLPLTGKIADAHGQPVYGANIRVTGQAYHTRSDTAGLFTLYLPAGKYRLEFSLDGHRTVWRQLDLISPASINIKLHALQQELNEVVVTDRYADRLRRSEALNVEAVNREFIQRNLGGSLMQTLERLPGIKSIGIGSGQSKPLIRGLGFNRVVVVDRGMKHEGQQWGADHGLEIDQFAAGEVELVKGAASFVYGSDAVAGAIHVKAPLPPAPHTAGGAVNLVGKSNNALWGFSANQFLRGKAWFYDARLTYQQYGDYTVPADTVYVYDFAVDLPGRRLRNTAGRETGLHLQAGYSGTRLRSALHLSHTYSHSGFFANAHGLEPRRVDTALHDGSARDLLMPRQRVNHFKLIHRTAYRLNDHDLYIDLGFQRNFRQEFSPYVNHGYMPPIFPADMRLGPNLERQFDKRVYALNLGDRFSTGRHQLHLGGNAEWQDNHINGWSFLVPAFRQFTAGAFVYDKLQLNERLLLHAAMRYDHARLQLEGYTDWFPSGSGGTAAYLARASELTRSFHSLVYTAGINYNLERFELKAHIGKSFRIPIAKELGANGVNYHYFSYERGNAALRPEVSWQADLGLAWKNAHWGVQFSPFVNYFTNYIYLNPTAAHDYFYGAGNQVFEYAQARVLRYGAELQLNYRPHPAWSVEVLGEYLHSQQLSGAKKGYTLPFSPPPSVLLNLTWHPWHAHGAKAYLAADYRITSAQNRIVPPEKPSPGYRVLHLQAGATLRPGGQPVEISLQVQNLLNTRYLNHTSFYRLIELPEAGRNVVINIRMPFLFTHQNK